MEFATLNDLYERVLPALKLKREEFRSAGEKYINEDDIWEYLKINKWSKANDLSLYNIVDDIIKCNASDIKAWLVKN